MKELPFPPPVEEQRTKENIKPCIPHETGARVSLSPIVGSAAASRSKVRQRIHFGFSPPPFKAKNVFGPMIDRTLAEPLLIEKHRRGVVMVISVDECGRIADHRGAGGKTGRVKGADRRDQ
jgi:hypothetical protein